MKTKLIMLCRDGCSDCRGMKNMLKRKEIAKALINYDFVEMNIDKVKSSVWFKWTDGRKFVLPLFVWLKNDKVSARSAGPLVPSNLLLKLKKWA